MSCTDPDHMEMPCPCDCGEWFDLNDGRPHPREATRIICEECAERIEKEVEREEEIEELKETIANAEFDLKEARERLAELNG